MAAAIEVGREQWLGYRWQGHGFGDRDAVLDDLLLLGFQDSRQSGAEQSQRQRTGKAPARGLVSMWSVRGAPHTHRASHLDFVRDALAPRDCDEGGAAYVEAVDEVAAALTKVVTSPTTKSDASSEVTQIVAKSLVTWCERCGADHVPDGLFRDAGRQAQLVLGDDSRTTMLKPTPKASQVTIDNPRLTLLTTFFRVNGPTSKTLYRDWVGGSTAGVAQEWGQLEDVVKVQVDNKRLDLPERLVDDVTNAPRAEGVVLVPPNDAYLRQVDRTLLVSDSKLRQQVWKAVSGPGALLIDGEVAGVCRYRRNDQTLTIAPFQGRCSASHRCRGERSARSRCCRRGADSRLGLSMLVCARKLSRCVRTHDCPIDSVRRFRSTR
ncbi:DNA glycosylase AlkZ-like family protein [Antrihabitans sp. NCIMB 15449]|uniref:DNA glycosylase AlkZ-like family protein n=1 Tax=Antrihabitans spumae TaxID=3373370 RepID=A0ABW7JPM1_9NOCA